jgi:phosphoribosylamine--glycine ligase
MDSGFGSLALPEVVNVLLVGGGAREHALASAIVQSKRLGTLYCTDTANPGLAKLGKPVDVPVSIREIYRLQQFCDHKAIHFVIVGPEDPLAEGFADKLTRLTTPTRLVFGPTMDGAQLEADKAWCKQLLRGAAIPTGDARVFADAEGARAYIETRELEDPVIDALVTQAANYRDPQERRKWIDEQRRTKKDVQQAYAAQRSSLPVIKASGLAKGKGVVVPSTLAQAMQAIEDIMVRRTLGEAGAKVVIEERLQGPEASVIALTDGRSILTLPVAQDHKRLGDNDTGPNTGGMGAYSPATIVDPAMLRDIEAGMLVPTLDALRREGILYRGVLFAGLMLTPSGPKVLEYNCRFGDPECQTLLRRIEGDVLDLLIKCAQGRLHEASIAISDNACCTVVLASQGYPEKPVVGKPITGVDAAERVPGVRVFFAGAKLDASGAILSSGGRVLSVTAVAPTLAEARERAYTAASAISFEGKVMRTDIGAKAPA